MYVFVTVVVDSLCANRSRRRQAPVRHRRRQRPPHSSPRPSRRSTLIGIIRCPVHQSSPSLRRTLSLFSLPTLAPLFRHSAPSSRSPIPPPSSFPRNLQPVASNDIVGSNASRRVSRTELDFEQALRGDGTVVLTEGPDIHSLGVDASTTPVSHRQSPSSSSVAHYSALRGAALDDTGMSSNTPVLLPPTQASASSVTTPKISLTRSRSPSSSSSSDRYYDAEDGDIQTKRRSVYRSQGTASSPDLATLVRKTKERNGMAQRELSNDGQRERNERHASKGVPNTTPTPSRDSTSSNRTRQRSSTSVHPHEQPLMPSSSKGKLTRTPKQQGDTKKGSMEAPISSDWVVTSPRPRTDTLSSKVRTFSEIFYACSQHHLVGKVVCTCKDVGPVGKDHGPELC